MRYLLIIISVLVAHTICMAQTIENPVFDRTDQPLFHIDKVELTKDSTIVYCTLSLEEGMWANISPDTYLENTLTTKKYRIVSCDGLPFAPQERLFNSTGKCNIRMSFPFCGNAEKMNLIETPNEKSLNVYGISMKECYEKDILRYSIEQASSLSSKANYFFTIKDYEKAAQYEEQAVNIKKRWYGKLSAEYENSLFMLGSYYICSLAFDKALKCFEEDEKLRSQLYGNHTELYSDVLKCLAICYENQNMSSKAIPCYEAALKIKEETTGKYNSEYAQTKGLLAQSYNKIGDIPKAIESAREATVLKKQLLGTHDEDYLISLLNFAQYTMWSDLSKSKGLFLNIVDTVKTYYGREHQLYILSTNLLSQCLMLLKKTDDAMFYAKENAEISLSLYGEQSLQYSLSMNLLAQIYEIMHDYDNAICYGMKSIQFVKSKMPAIQLSKNLHSIATCYAKKNDFGNALKYSQDAIQVFKNIIFHDFDKLSSEQKYSLWQRLHRIYDSGYPLYVANSKSAASIIELYNNILYFKGITSTDINPSNYSWKDIQNSLKSNEIAIEFLESYDGKTIYFYALTIKRGYKSPKLFRLLDTSQWDKLIKDRNNNIILQDYMLYQLGQYIWGPLTEELDGVNNVYFSPTSSFHTLGIEYLPCGDKEYYSERYNFYRLSSTAKIIAINPRREYSKANLFGGLNYSDTSDFTRNNKDNRSGFDYLANTYEEVMRIAETLKTKGIDSKIFSGDEGSEADFLLLEKEKFELLHLATHGENVDRKDVNKEKELNNLLFLQNSSGIDNYVYKDDAMSWSYLVMSGGNQLLSRTEKPISSKDGILTALEISKMKFQILDMVVLSACKTALGFWGVDDGILGLQQGFKMAGAETILMSYSEVDDEATMILMVEFYKNLMNGKTKLQSLKEAQQYLRLVENGRYDDPKYWATFIMLDGLN